MGLIVRFFIPLLSRLKVGASGLESSTFTALLRMDATSATSATMADF
jgi:hypothetical protein